MISAISEHENCQLFSYYGTDIRVTEGPIVHSNYRGQQIATGFNFEVISICQNKDVEILLCDPESIAQPSCIDAGNHILKTFGFESIQSDQATVYKRDILI